jgi:hypothetical protein
MNRDDDSNLNKDLLNILYFKLKTYVSWSIT